MLCLLCLLLLGSLQVLETKLVVTDECQDKDSTCKWCMKDVETFAVCLESQDKVARKSLFSLRRALKKSINVDKVANAGNITWKLDSKNMQTNSTITFFSWDEENQRGEPIPGACQIPVTKGNHLIPCVDRKVILRMSVHKRSCRMLVNYFIPEELDACNSASDNFRNLTIRNNYCWNLTEESATKVHQMQSENWLEHDVCIEFDPVTRLFKKLTPGKYEATSYRNWYQSNAVHTCANQLKEELGASKVIHKDSPKHVAGNRTTSFQIYRAKLAVKHGKKGNKLKGNEWIICRLTQNLIKDISPFSPTNNSGICYIYLGNWTGERELNLDCVWPNTDLEVELPRRKSEKQKHEWIYVVAVFGGILIAVVFICAIIVVNRKTKAFFLSTKLIHPTLVETMKSSEKMNDLFPNACDKEKVDVPLPEDLVSLEHIKGTTSCSAESKESDRFLDGPDSSADVFHDVSYRLRPEVELEDISSDSCRGRVDSGAHSGSSKSSNVCSSSAGTVSSSPDSGEKVDCTDSSSVFHDDCAVITYQTNPEPQRKYTESSSIRSRIDSGIFFGSRHPSRLSNIEDETRPNGINDNNISNFQMFFSRITGQEQLESVPAN